MAPFDVLRHRRPFQFDQSIHCEVVGQLEPAGPRGARLWRHPVFAGTLVVLACLLFCWPFARGPRPPLWRAYLHMFGLWAAIIVVLVWMSRHLESRSRRAGRDD